MKLKYWEWSCIAHELMAAGVYAILDINGHVLYVGETINFMQRWGQHCQGTLNGHQPVPKKEIFKFAVLEYIDSRELRLDSEARYIRELQPKYGRGHSTRIFSTSSRKNPLRVRKLTDILNRRNLSPAQYEPEVSEDNFTSVEEQELRRIRNSWLDDDTTNG